MTEPNFHRQKPMKAIICKACKGMGSPAPLRAICMDCNGRRVQIVEDKPPAKSQLWRKVARLMGELAFGLEQDTLVDRNGVVKAVPLARALIRAGQQNRKTKRLAAKLDAALKAWENA